MQIKPDCIPCILTMTVGAIRKLDLVDDTARTFFTDVLTIPGLRGQAWRQTSPDIIEIVMRKLSAAMNDADPFRTEKIDLNKRVMAIYPLLEKMVADSADPLNTAARISIMGNSIDFMVPEATASLEDFILEKIKVPLDTQAFDAFSRQLRRTKRMLLFADNCGEIVCDKLFIETIKRRYDIDVTVVVRHLPTLNDATLDAAIDAGLDQVATVIDNGMDGPLPGTVLQRCTQAVRERVQGADLIIAKGGGNFDSLEESLPFFKASRLNITFMLLSKCHPIGAYFGIARNHPILANFFHSAGS